MLSVEPSLVRHSPHECRGAFGHRNGSLSAQPDCTSRTRMFHSMMRLLASFDASPHSMRHCVQNAPHPPITRVSCFTLGVFFYESIPRVSTSLPGGAEHAEDRRACGGLRAEVRHWDARSPALTSLGLALDEALQKPELEWLGLRGPSSLAPLLRCPGRPARSPRARHGVLRRTGGLRLSCGQ